MDPVRSASPLAGRHPLRKPAPGQTVAAVGDLEHARFQLGLRRIPAIRRLLVRERLTEADIRLFVTLIRFDAAYNGLFKCNKRRIADYPTLTAYLTRLLDIPEIRATVSIDHIKQGYYSIRALNPNGIVPLGPDLALNV